MPILGYPMNTGTELIDECVDASIQLETPLLSPKDQFLQLPN
jgi:hypothetical protein